MLRIAVVDDDKHYLKTIKGTMESAIMTLSYSTEVVYFNDGLKFFDAFRDDFDVIMLDVDMPTIGGMELAKLVREAGSRAELVFITNLPQFAIKGYEYEAIDYLIKPVSVPSMTAVLKRILKKREKTVRNEAKIVITYRSGFNTIIASSIYYVEVRQHTIIYHTTDGDYETRGALRNIEQKLTDVGFFKCNNCYLVNLSYVDSVTDKTVIVNGTPLQISRNRKKAFVEKYLEFTR